MSTSEKAYEGTTEVTLNEWERRQIQIWIEQSILDLLKRTNNLQSVSIKSELRAQVDWLTALHVKLEKPTDG